jgi:hypothetical protein
VLLTKPKYSVCTSANTHIPHYCCQPASALPPNPIQSVQFTSPTEHCQTDKTVGHHDPHTTASNSCAAFSVSVPVRNGLSLSLNTSISIPVLAAGPNPPNAVRVKRLRTIQSHSARLASPRFNCPVIPPVSLGCWAFRSEFHDVLYSLLDE